MSKTRLIAKNTIYLYIRTGLTILITLYTSRILLNELGTVDFGLYFLIAGFVLLLGFLKSSLASGVQRFLSYEEGRKDVNKLNDVFSMAINIHLIVIVIFVFLGETIGLSVVNNLLTIPSDRISATIWVYHSSLIGFCFTLATLPHLALILSREHIKIFATITFFESVIKLVIAYSLSWIIYDNLITYALLILLLNILISTAYVIYCKLRFPDVSYRFMWDNLLFKTVTSFSAWTILGNLSAVMSNHGAGVLLNIFFGPVLNAAKTIANQIEAASVSFSDNFVVALRPPIIKAYSSGEYSYATRLVCSGSKYSYFLMFLVTFAFFFNLRSVLDVWLGEYPEEAIQFTQVILLVSLLTAISRPLTAAVQASGNIKAYQLVVGGIQLLSIPIAYIFFRAGMAAIWVFYTILIVNIVAFVARILMLRRVFHFSIRHYICTSIIPVILVSLITCYLTFLLNVNIANMLLNMFSNVVIDFLVTLMIIVLLGLSQDEHKFLISKIHNCLGFRR